MPGLNQKGPEGVGMMTGRQRGLCRRIEDQSFDGTGSGRGRGMGMRRGLGQGQGLGQGLRQGRGAAGGAELSENPKIDKSEELVKLREEYHAAQKTLSMIEEKIAALEGREGRE